jgi:Tfp pilus assembly protein PilF
LSSTYAEWERRPAAEQVPKGLERIKKDVELPHSRRVEEMLANSGQRDQQELARFYLDRGRRLFEQENDREALLELDRTLFLSPYQADAHLLIGRIHLRNGRAHDAMDALKISLWSQETAAAHAALAEAYLEAKDPASARAEVERALALDPASPDAKRVIDKLPRP